MIDKAINYLAVALMCGLIGFVGAKVFGRNNVRIATVNITEVIANQQERSIKDLVDGGGDDRKRKDALRLAEAFGKRINDEVAAMSFECKCLILMREAVVAGDVEDMTARLVARLAEPTTK